MNSIHKHDQQQKGHEHHSHTPQHQYRQQGHSHAQVSVPQTEGRLIRQGRSYDIRLWLMFLGRINTLRKLPIELAQLKAGERVLDVGCGTGDLALAAAQKVGPAGTVYGIDAAPEMIEAARDKAIRAGGNVHFRLETVEALSFPDNSFDAILSSLMMHHLPPDLKRRALAEIRRVLRPGGRIVIVDLGAASKMPRPWEPGWMVAKLHRLQAQPGAVGRADGAALGNLLREAGFDSVRNGPTRYTWIGYAIANAPDNP